MMPNEPEKISNMSTNKQSIHSQLPIDLGNKVIVKPANDNTKMPIQPTFRTINQQPTSQMRVVRMPGTAGTPGTTQIIQTHVVSPPTLLKPTVPGRSTITVSKSPAAQYLPRVTALNTIQSAKGTSIRTPTPPSTVSGISPAFVRSALTPRTSSPSTVIAQPTAWVNNAGAVQVQVPQQIIRSTITPNRTITANIFGQQNSSQQSSSINVSTSSSGPSASGQQTYVATVLPQRTPQGATIVYTSQPQQPFLQGQVSRMGLSAASTNARQIRPIQRISTAGIRVNTSLSIRQNLPSLTPTTVLATPPRNPSSGIASTTISNTIPARIFQVQSPQTPGGSQVINQSNQKILSANVMLPIIVNSNRITHTKNQLQPNIIAHVSKLGTVSDGTIISSSLTNSMPSISSNSMVASIQSSQVSQANQNSSLQQSANHQTIYTTQSSAQSGNQIITVSQQQSQMISSQSQQQNVQTVVPLTLGSRPASIKTITVSTSNAGSLDHRNLSSNQATTIMPISKILSQGNHQNLTPVQSLNSSSTSTVYFEQPGSQTNSANVETKSQTLGESFGPNTNIRYTTEKMIHSIIQSSLQNNSSNSNSSSTIRFSPSVVESQISSATSAGQQQLIGSIVQAPSLEAAVASAMIVPAPSTSPRGQVLSSGSSAVLRKLSETTPTKPVKKQAKTKGVFLNETLMQTKVTQQKPLSAAVAQLTQKLKPLDTRQQSLASSPKTTFSERESSPHDEWSDGSTTVSIPNSPRTDDEDLEEMILNNTFNFNLKNDEEFSFIKTQVKPSSGVKREPELRDIQLTPKKKIKLEIVEKSNDVNNENNVDVANKGKRDLVLKKPQASLLQQYTNSWKFANNHFMKHSDVKVRDDFRKPNVMDLANQPKIAQRAEGWKTHLIGSEIQELVKDEHDEGERLNDILKQLELTNSSPEMDKVCELIKGSMQRSRLVIESFNDSKLQLMKIFDHKNHALDIINRCASKRNFKKR